MNIIEEIKSKINIVDLAFGLGLQPTKQGFIYSIYKDENNRSLMLYAKTNSYYCFATGQGGDVLKFYADYKGISIKEAVRELAIKYTGVKMESRNTIETKKNNSKSYQPFELTESEQEGFEEKMKQINTFDENDYRLGLNKIHNDIMEERRRIQAGIFKDFKDFCNGIGNGGYEYLTGKERGLSVESIATSGLFEIRDLKQTIEYLTDSYTSDMLKVSGLFNKDCKFVFWNHHIVIPYYEEGKITWLRGRTNPLFIKDEKISRYISPSNFATNLTAKRFYNIDVLNGIDPTSQILICEGEFDTIRTKQEGFISIGVPGINGIPDNLKEILKSFEIYLGFDSDVAGENAARTFTDQLGREVTYLYLKDHKDLTEYFNESE